MKTKVLVVEDEAAIRMGLCDVLAYHGLDPVGAADGRAGLDLALGGEFGLVLLDVMMPGLDGFTVCERLREARPAQAILMLTAKGAESDVLRGFEVGADDYVTKPFSVAQLMARVQALLRRSGSVVRRFRIAGIEVDPDRLTAEGSQGSTELSTRDVELLAYLASQPGRPISREELLKEVWGYARVDRVETRCVDMAVVKLRRRLADVDPAEVIETVRGVGYRCGG
ncbi:MAG: response regulator transcription factor [Alphaproteobacteria bacterium]|nr:response regulator transcription factor [Alphaproteobacteria bacterium]MCB9691122.1 response regulator transcription factor [Alphaproteobacteria bacterium]